MLTIAGNNIQVLPAKAKDEKKIAQEDIGED